MTLTVQSLSLTGVYIVPCPQSPCPSVPQSPVPSHPVPSLTIHCCPVCRFIPPELDFVRPSLMRQATLGSVSTDSHLLEPLTPPPPDVAPEDEVSSKAFFEGHSHSSACSALHRMMITIFMSHRRLLPFTCPPTHSCHGNLPALKQLLRRRAMKFCLHVPPHDSRPT